MAQSTICTILKNRETIKKADVAREVTVITKQRSQTIEEEVKNLCTKYCCKSLNKQSSGAQERINPFYINSYGENSFGLRTFRFTNISVYEHFCLRTFRFTNISVYEHFCLRTFRFTNDLQERIKFVNRGLTVLAF